MASACRSFHTAMLVFLRPLWPVHVSVTGKSILCCSHLWPALPSPPRANHRTCQAGSNGQVRCHEEGHCEGHQGGHECHEGHQDQGDAGHQDSHCHEDQGDEGQLQASHCHEDQGDKGQQEASHCHEGLLHQLPELQCGCAGHEWQPACAMWPAMGGFVPP